VLGVPSYILCYPEGQQYFYGFSFLQKTLFYWVRLGFMGFALQQRNGFLRTENLPKITLYHIDSNVRVLGSETTGNSFRIENGAWACMGKGVAGVDSLKSNTLLIAQITTKGQLSYELNLMLRNADGSIVNYVAKDPIEKEVLHKSLLSNN
jgi:hypothetical protein